MASLVSSDEEIALTLYNLFQKMKVMIPFKLTRIFLL